MISSYTTILSIAGECRRSAGVIVTRPSSGASSPRIRRRFEKSSSLSEAWWTSIRGTSGSGTGSAKKKKNRKHCKSEHHSDYKFEQPPPFHSLPISHWRHGRYWWYWYQRNDALIFEGADSHIGYASISIGRWAALLLLRGKIHTHHHHLALQEPLWRMTAATWDFLDILLTAV